MFTIVVIRQFIRIFFITFNALRAEQTETWTHLDQLLEQLPIRCDL